MSKYCIFMMILVALAVVGFTTNAQASVLLFSDTFDGTATPVSPDYSLNDNLAGRQSGYLVTGPGGSAVQWARGISTTAGDYTDKLQVNSAEGTSMLVSYGTGSQKMANNAIIQHDFAYNGGFTVRWDMDPISSCSLDTKHNHSGSIFIGSGDGTQSYLATDEYTGEYDTHSDLALSITDQGKLRVRWMDTNSSLNGTSYAHLPKTGNRYYSDEIDFDAARFALVGNDSSNYTQMYTFELRVDTADYEEGTLASASLWVMAKDNFTWPSNGVQVDLNPADATSMTFEWHWDADGVNYMGFGMNVDTTAATQFDNVQVFVSEIPEPSTLALLAAGLVGLLAYAWRKRK